MGALVSVALPVLNGARYLYEVLGAVRGQQLDGEVEIVVVDSGSRDGSREIARRHGARVHEIARAEFSHGATRNLLMELATAPHVAFLTQDATPASPRWLRALLDGFAATEDVAAVFGPHRVRPGASHMIAAEMDRHFRQWEADPAMRVQRLDRSPAGLAAYRAAPGRWTFLSSVNGCLSRAAWKQVPFRPIPYAEDQLLGRELIEAGWAKVYAPEAAVLHSHDYSPWDFFRRYFDEWRSLREVLDHVQPAGPRRSLRDVKGLVGADRRWLRAQGVHGRDLVRPLAVSGRHHTIRTVAAVVGSRADRLSPGTRRALSFEGQATFSPIDVPPSPLLSSGGRMEPDWAWELVRQRYPLQPVRTEPHPPRAPGPMTLAWVVPPWRVGSGGHMTLFRLIARLEARGHACAIFVDDPLRRERRPAAALRREISDHFVPVAAPVFRGLAALDGADVALATSWPTAWALRDLPACREKAYVVQDFEADFEPASAERIWAEETYRMGYQVLACTPWLAGELRQRYGTDATSFDFGTDLDVYSWGEESEREPGLVAVYTRLETPRRGTELALAGVATLMEQRPGTRIALFGTRKSIPCPVPVEDLGVRSPAELAALYRRASAGIAFSLTNRSLVAQEMMAAGLPVVELDGPNVTGDLGESGDLALLVPPRPDDIAAALARLLDDRAAAAAMAARARPWVESRTWERATDQVETALQGFMSTRGQGGG